VQALAEEAIGRRPAADFAEELCAFNDRLRADATRDTCRRLRPGTSGLRNLRHIGVQGRPNDAQEVLDELAGLTPGFLSKFDNLRIACCQHRG
jgi:hypothetical protein